MLNLLQQRKGHLCSVHGMAKSRCIPPISTILEASMYRTLEEPIQSHHRPRYLHAAQVELLHLQGSHVRSVHVFRLLNPVDFPAMPLTGRFQQRHKKGIGWLELIAQYFHVSALMKTIAQSDSCMIHRILPTCPCAAHATLPDFHQLPLQQQSKIAQPQLQNISPKLLATKDIQILSSCRVVRACAC